MTGAALVDEAKRLEIPVLGHIPFPVGLQGVLASGQVNIAHVEEFFQTGDIEDSKIDGPELRLRFQRCVSLILIRALSGGTMRFP